MHRHAQNLRGTEIDPSLLVASSTRSESVIEPIAAISHEVFLSKITTARALKKAITPYIPPDEQFRLAFEVVTVSKAALARYYLRSLEMAAKKPWFIPNDDRQVIACFAGDSPHGLRAQHGEPTRLEEVQLASIPDTDGNSVRKPLSLMILPQRPVR